MSQTAHDYLYERFRNDAATLLDRVAALARGAKIPGPDAVLSRRMADACTDVATRVAALPRAGEAGLDALLTLATTLDTLAGAVTDAPAVRAVYAGAATRMREIVHAERRATAAAPRATDAIADDEVGDHDGDDEIADEDMDGDMGDDMDDDVDDDELADGADDAEGRDGGRS